MPKNKVNDPITDQEMAFARQVLSGGMTDRQAAEAVGLNPDSAAYTKSKPRVRAYMLEYRAAVQEQLVQQDAKEQHRRSLDREQVLDRLWEIANLSPETTRGSVTGQVKALSIIVAIEGLIPDRRAATKESAPPLPAVNIYRAPWLPKRPGETTDPEPSPDLVPNQEDPAIPDPPPAAAPDTNPAPSPASAFSETVSSAVLDPTAAFSKKPYVRRYGPF